MANKFKDLSGWNKTDLVTIYMITHTKSNMSYIGQFNRNPEIRFIEHFTGYGSRAIWDLICDGFSSFDFCTEILEQGEFSKKEAGLLETWYVQKHNTRFPTGLNIGFSASTYIKFKNMQTEYSNNGWCIAHISKLLENKWVAIQNNNLQNQIELNAKNQYSDKCISLSEMEKMENKQAKRIQFHEHFCNKGHVGFLC